MSSLLKYIFCDILPEDILSLYTSIPNNEGIAATKKRYDNYIHKTLPTKIIATFLALILTLINFVFNSNFYLQIKGCAMGTICAPAYVNIFVAEFKQKYIYPLIKDKSIIFFSILVIPLWCGPNLKNRVPKHFSLYRSTK